MPFDAHKLFTDLVSGTRGGVLAGAARAVLRGAEVPYRLAVTYRNWRFDRSLAPAQRVDLPVISVGNITVGGTGKTPLVAWLSKWFLDRGLQVALISRGYGSSNGAPNDEALELALELPEITHVQNADRVAAAEQLVEQTDAQLILLDDAFQHRRLARDLDIVLLDALVPFGYEHLLPRGLLREPLSGLARADVIAVSRCDLVEPERLAAIIDRLREHAPGAIVIQIAQRPRALVNVSGDRRDVGQLAAWTVAAFCGIGNPEGFLRTLETCGARPAGFREFADHHTYSETDGKALARWAQAYHADALICTRKDLVKFDQERLGSAELWALEIGSDVVQGREDLEERLQSIQARVDPGRERSPDS